MIYIDILIIEDIILNYIILISTGYLLNRITKFYKIISASFIGAIPLILLTTNINKILLLLINLIFITIISIISFTYHDILYTIKNIIYIIMISIFLAGSIYFINTNIFPHLNNYLLNTIILIIISPIITFIYIKLLKKLTSNYSNYYRVDIYLKNGTSLTLNSYLDTGNILKDPYTLRPIILVDKRKINIMNEKIIYVPYSTIKDNSLLECIYPKKVILNNTNIKVLIGLTNNIGIEGADCILNREVIERIKND